MPIRIPMDVPARSSLQCIRDGLLTNVAINSTLLTKSSSLTGRERGAIGLVISSSAELTRTLRILIDNPLESSYSWYESSILKRVIGFGERSA